MLKGIKKQEVYNSEKRKSNFSSGEWGTKESVNVNYTF